MLILPSSLAQDLIRRMLKLSNCDGRHENARLALKGRTNWPFISQALYTQLESIKDLLAEFATILAYTVRI